MYKYSYYRKTIKEEHKVILGLTEFKLSLKDIHKKHQNVVKSIFEIEIDKVYNNIQNFNKEKFKEYMELVYHKTLSDLYNINNSLLLDKYLNIKNNEKPDYALIDLFKICEEHEEVDNNFKTATLKNNKRYRQKLLDFLPQGITYNQITKEQVEEFKKVNLALGANSWNNVLAQINKSFNYLVEKKKLIDENKFSSLDTRESAVIEKEDFEKEEIENIINNCNQKELKMAMIIQSFTGMRIGEIVPLKYKNLKDLECLNINYLKDTKTKKHNRLIPIHKTLKRELIKYFEKNNIKNDDDKLFKMKKLNDNVNKQIKKQINIINKKIIKDNATKKIDIINGKIINEEAEKAYKTSHGFRYKFVQELNHHHQDLANYITVLCGHTTDKDGKYHKKSNNINFDLYNKGKANWDTLVKMIHCFDFDIK